ncbi:MAG TPA: hypothetical protein VLG11_00130 [Candidatus Saccharimonadales bacterium]|nr:hypothetical protein [Candidatus Saccharimonadales bacterium]
MIFFLSILAAFACALCTGIGAILQKASADKEKPVHGIKLGFLWSLLHNWKYVLGVVIDTLGWVFVYLAVQHIPLFFAEAIVSSNLLITALLEHFVLHTPLPKRAYFAVILVLCGLGVLGLAAGQEAPRTVSLHIEWALALVPIVALVLAAAVGRSKQLAATAGVALLGGVAFGETSVISRVFPLPHPLWHALTGPLLYGLIASGIVGVLLFSTALQRTHATVANACLTISQTFVPAIIGLAVLGDTVRAGRWYAVVLGLGLSVAGTLYLMMVTRHTTKIAAL